VGGYGLEFPEIPSFHTRIYMHSPIVSFCQSDDTNITRASVFLLPFFVSAPETVQRIQGPLTTRVIIKPDPIATAFSELRVSTEPLPCHYLPKSIARSFLFYYFITLRRIHTRSIPIIHGCDTKRKHTSGLWLRVLIHQFLANYNTI
jgi:hypothetical protein